VTKGACSFTGHRILSAGELPQINARLDEIIGQLADRGIERYLLGGALGFDTLAAKAVLRQRERNSRIELVMCLPCKSQEKYWPVGDKNTYFELLAAADETVYVSERYFTGCMAKRNLYMVENSEICVAYLKRAGSGTGQTVRMARERGLEVANLYCFGYSEFSRV